MKTREFQLWRSQFLCHCPPKSKPLFRLKRKPKGCPLIHSCTRQVLEIISAAREVKQAEQQLSPEEFERAFEEIADMIPESVSPIPDEALSRESIYTREDEW